MKDYKRLTRKKEITECEIVDDKRYSVGFKQIPHKINKNIIKGIYTICNDMDGQGDYIKGDIVDKIADLEDKIERGEIVDRNSYLDYLLAAKDTSELTDKEIEFFAKHNAEVRKQTMEECLRTLRDISSPGLVEPFWVGWSEAISAAIKEISETYGASVEEVFEE